MIIHLLNRLTQEIPNSWFPHYWFPPNEFTSSVSCSTKQAGISHFIKVKCSTQEVENPKPWPDLFLYTAKKIKPDPKKTVVFEDARSGILAAKKAGMKKVAGLI